MHPTYKILLLVVFSLVYTSCSDKADTDPEINQQGSAISLYKSTLNQGEVGLILTNQIITDISASINDQGIDLTNTSEGYIFTVPMDITKGAYTLDVVADGSTKNLNLTITEIANIPDPDDYMNKEIEKINTQITTSKVIKDKLPADEQAAYLQDIETIEGWIAQYQTAFNALTPEEKLSAAKTIAANKQNFDDLVAAVDQLNVSTLKLKKAELENHEEIIEDAMQEYTYAVIAVARSTAIAAVLTGGGFLTFGPIGAAIGGGIGAGLVALKFKELSAAQSVLLNNTFLPFENLFAKFKKSTLEFENGQYKEISVSANYRSLGNQDLNNQTPIVKSFVSNALKAKQTWDDLMQKLDVNMEYSGKKLEDISQTNTQSRDIHSSNFDVRNISSSNITPTIDRTDGLLRLKFTSSKEEDEEFTFDIVYSNERFGSLTHQVDAKYIAGEPEPLSGRWISTTQLGDPDDTYYLIMNFKGMDCSCLDFSFKDVSDGTIFDGTNGNCIFTTSTTGKYIWGEVGVACPPIGDDIEGNIYLVSKTESELTLRITDPDGSDPQTINFRPY